MYMGYAYLALKEIEKAQVAFAKSIEIRKDLDQPALLIEPIAGLVETFLLANDLEAASHEGEKILTFLESGSTLDGTDEPLRVYYACYQLLEIKQDPRSKLILQTAINLLEAQVSKLKDESSRGSFIKNFPWRQALYNASKP
jgi:hypothetical protein